MHYYGTRLSENISRREPEGYDKGGAFRKESHAHRGRCAVSPSGLPPVLC